LELTTKTPAKKAPKAAVVFEKKGPVWGENTMLEERKNWAKRGESSGGRKKPPRNWSRGKKLR